MTDACKYLVDAVRQAPDEVILDLVRSALARGGVAPAASGRQAASAQGTVLAGDFVIGDEPSYQPPNSEPIPLRLGTSGRLLRVLARARSEDAAAGDDRAGWRSTGELCAELDVSHSHLHVLVYRARNVLRKAGLPDDVIARHRRTRSLRLALEPRRFRGVDRTRSVMG